MNCAQCSRPVVAHYRITRVDANADTKLDIVVCSVICLIQWAYAHAAEQSVKVATAAKGALGHLADLLKGR